MPFEIPEVGSLIRRDKVEAQHPQYARKARLYRLYRACYELSGGFEGIIRELYKNTSLKTGRDVANKEETYLIPHPREDVEDFLDRLEQVYLPNFVKHRVVAPLTGFLTDTTPNRDNHPEWLQKWMENCSIDGQDWDSWRKTKGIPYGLVYGSFPVIIDSDQGQFETEQERLDAGAEFAKLREIHPDNIIDWQCNRTGHYSAIKYVADIDTWDPIDGHQFSKRYTWILPEGYFWVDDTVDPSLATNIYDPSSGAPISMDHTPQAEAQNLLRVAGSGVWPWIGMNLPQRAPICEFRFFNGQSILHDIAPLVKRWFNLESEKTELERKGCFSILFVPDGDKGDAKVVGSTSFWAISENAKIPAYVTPPMEPVQHLSEEGDRICQWILELGGTSSFYGASAEAAATMAYRFQTTSNQLETMAGDAIISELDFAEVAGLWHDQNLDDAVSTVIDSTFDAVDLERYLANVDVAKNKIGLPPTAEKIAKRRVITKLFDDLSKEEADQIEMELEEEMLKKEQIEIEATQQIPTPEGMEIPEGTPELI